MSKIEQRKQAVAHLGAALAAAIHAFDGCEEDGTYCGPQLNDILEVLARDVINLAMGVQAAVREEEDDLTTEEFEAWVQKTAAERFLRAVNALSAAYAPYLRREAQAEPESKPTERIVPIFNAFPVDA